MNREIKFRAQRTDTKEFVYGYYRKNTFFDLFGDIPKEVYTKHFIGSFDNIKKFDGLFEQVEVIPEAVGQFTGLLDKNGKEIYEGDVIKWDDMSKGKYWRFAVVEMNPDILFNCKFINEVNGIKNSANHIFRFGKFIYKDTHNHIEIIGNVYENPNLIN